MKFLFIICTVTEVITRICGTKSILVKENSTATLTCHKAPSTGITWKKQTPTHILISINSTIGPDKTNLKNYKVKFNQASKSFDLLIKPFTAATQGEYLGSTIDGKHLQDCLYRLALCDVPNEIVLFYDVIDTSITSSQQNHINLICQPIDKLAKNTIDSFLKIEIIGSNNTRMKQYHCITLNEGQCKVTERTNLSLHFENWLETSRSLEKRLLNFVCNSNADTESDQSDREIKVFYTKDTFYLMDVKFESYECRYNGSLEKEGSKEVLNPYFAFLPAVLCFVAVILVIFAVFALVKGIGWRYQVSNAINVQDVDASNSIQNRINESRDQEYSSFERRQRRYECQPVTYSVCRPKIQDRERTSANNQDSFGELPETERKKLKQRVESSDLNYVEVEITPCKSKPAVKKMNIIGETPYADVDFALKADPLPEDNSSGEEQEKNDDNDNGFITFEEMQELRKIRGIEI